MGSDQVLESIIAQGERDLRASSREGSPESWARAHAMLGSAFAYRTLGDPTHNLEQALEHFTAGTGSSRRAFGRLRLRFSSPCARGRSGSTAPPAWA